MLYFLLCNQICRHAKFERSRRTWLLFAHSTTIFIVSTIEVGCFLKFFEINFVTCWEDFTQVDLAGDICIVLLIWLQDGLLVSGLI
jgi:hypothetical protein